MYRNALVEGGGIELHDAWIPRAIRALRLAAFVAIVGTAVACSFHRTLGEQAVDFNRSVAESESRVLLLNVLRSRDRLPQYYTGLTQIRGSLSGTLASTLSIPFGGGSDNKNAISPTFSMASSPSFDLSVLDSKEFFRGITDPVSLETFRYYWDQGWPRDVLAYMLVRAVRLEAPDGQIVHEITSHGERSEPFDEFVRELAADGSLLDQPFWTTGPTPFGPKLTALTGEAVVDAKAKGLGFAVAGGPNVEVQLTSGTSVSLTCLACSQVVWKNFRATAPATYARFAECGSQVGETARGRVMSGLPAAELRLFQLRSPDPPAEMEVLVPQGTPKPKEDPKDDCPKLNLLLRSPEAMIYFLGETLRSPERAPRVRPPEGPPATNADVPLFTLEESRWPWGLFAVRHRGHFYAVPAELETSRTLSALALIRQLFALQKSREDLPTTRAVTVIGR
jgi:hypothetical protein